MVIRLIIKNHKHCMILHDTKYIHSGEGHLNPPTTTEMTFTEDVNAKIYHNLGEREPLKPDKEFVIDMETEDDS